MNNNDKVRHAIGLLQQCEANLAQLRNALVDAERRHKEQRVETGRVLHTVKGLNKKVLFKNRLYAAVQEEQSVGNDVETGEPAVRKVIVCTSQEADCEVIDA